MDTTQQPDVVTQTIIRQSATLTTALVLGTGAVPATSNPSAPDVGAKMNGQLQSISSAEIGAILGCVVAFVFVAIGGCICYCNRRRPKQRYYCSESGRGGSSYDGLHYDEKATLPRRPPKVAEFIPGGPEFPTYRAVPSSNFWIENYPARGHHFKQGRKGQK